jgi:Sec-independent protein translocase protein TatA
VENVSFIKVITHVILYGGMCALLPVGAWLLKKGKLMKKLKSVLSHLKGDIKGYKKEINEDKELMKQLKEKETKVGKKQGYNDRLDESLGMRHKGKHKQSMKDRRDESKGMEKAMGKKAYSSVKTMDRKSRKK